MPWSSEDVERLTPIIVKWGFRFMLFAFMGNVLALGLYVIRQQWLLASWCAFNLLCISWGVRYSRPDR